MVKRIIAKMGTSKNNYYRDNLQQSLVDMDKTPEKHLLLQNRGPPASPKNTYVAQGPLGAQTRLTESGNPSEKQTLLQPVKLSPGWEEKDVPADELNFRNLPYEDDSKDDHGEPRDRCKLVYFILLLHGIGILMPWNMFITAEKYFTEYKLNTTSVEDAHLVTDFSSYLGIYAQIPNVLFSAINIFIQLGGSLTRRIVWSILVIVIIFITTIILAMIDSSDWPKIFFYITMASVTILNMANGIYQNTIYGIAANLPSEYTNAVILGSNLSGVLTSVISIATIGLASNLRTAAIYYFITALFVLLVCFDTYFALPLLRFYRHHDLKNNQKKSLISNPAVRSSRPPYWYIFKKAWVQFFNVWFVFFVTLTIFPAVLVRIKSLHIHNLFHVESSLMWDVWFTQLTCYLCFNVFAWIGNFIPFFLTRPGPRWVWIPIILRSLLIPFFMFCNYKPDKRVMPVLIDNDWAYISMVVVMSLTSGYFSSLSMMYAPRCVEPQYASTAGMMAAFFLVLGIFSGVCFSFAISYIIEVELFRFTI